VAFTEDISTSGMFIKTPNIASVNSIIKIQFTLPDGSFVGVEGRVTWARKVPQNLFHLVKKAGWEFVFFDFFPARKPLIRFSRKLQQPVENGRRRACVKRYS
jgi:hypothetical protein